MASIRFLNQASPFWDFIASLDQGNHRGPASRETTTDAEGHDDEHGHNEESNRNDSNYMNWDVEPWGNRAWDDGAWNDSWEHSPWAWGAAGPFGRHGPWGPGGRGGRDHHRGRGGMRGDFRPGPPGPPGPPGRGHDHRGPPPPPHDGSTRPGQGPPHLPHERPGSPPPPPGPHHGPPGSGSPPPPPPPGEHGPPPHHPQHSHHDRPGRGRHHNHRGGSRGRGRPDEGRRGRPSSPPQWLQALTDAGLGNVASLIISQLHGPDGFDLNNLNDAINNLMPARRATDGTTTGPNNTDIDFVPPVDVFDMASAYHVHVSIPGAKKEDISVTWDAASSSLVVSGVLYRPGDEELLKCLALDERKVGAFERKVILGSVARPANVEVEGIKAKMEDGILRVEIPKKVEDGEWEDVIRVDVD